MQAHAQVNVIILKKKKKTEKKQASKEPREERIRANKRMTCNSSQEKLQCLPAPPDTGSSTANSILSQYGFLQATASSLPLLSNKV